MNSHLSKAPFERTTTYVATCSNGVLMKSDFNPYRDSWYISYMLRSNGCAIVMVHCTGTLGLALCPDTHMAPHACAGQRQTSTTHNYTA